MRKLRVPANRLSGIVRGRRAVSAETALRLGRCFGTGARFLMNLQSNDEMARAHERFGAAVLPEVEAA